MYENAQVAENLQFLNNLPKHVVGFLLKGDETLEEIVVFFNPNNYPVQLHAFGKYGVYADGNYAGAEPCRTVENDYEVAPISAIVLGRVRESKPENEEETLNA